jgi:ATPases with chaperone activity, ATP-binding subunit
MLQDSKNVALVKKEAYNIALQTGGEIGSEHLLAGLVLVENSIANRLLRLHGVSLKKIQSNFHTVKLLTEPFYSARSKRILQNAAQFAAECRQSVVGTEHLLAAIINEQDSIGYAILSNAADDINALKNNLIEILREQREAEDNPFWVYRNHLQYRRKRFRRNGRIFRSWRRDGRYKQAYAWQNAGGRQAAEKGCCGHCGA